MIRFFSPLLVLTVLAGCTPEPASPVSEEVPPRAGEDPPSQSESASRVEPEVEQAPSSAAALRGDPMEKAVATEAVQEEPSTGTVEESAPPAPRDLATELTFAVGNLRSCMQDSAIVRSSIEVSATALVLATGTVTHASVTGVGLSQRERNCIANRVRAVVLEPLEGQSATRISTRIVIDLSTPAPVVTGYQVGPPDPALRNVREPLPKRPEVAPSGRPIQEPTSRPIQEPTSRPIQEPKSRKVRGPKPRPIDGWDVDQSSKDWR